jgi:hypothetical protein
MGRFGSITVFGSDEIVPSPRASGEGWGLCVILGVQHAIKMLFG